MDLRSWRTLATLGLTLAGRGLVEWAWHVPVGFLAVLALGRRPPGALGRLALWLEACALGIGLATAVAVLRLRPLGVWPGPLELLLPVAGVVAGTWPGLAWTRGWRARILFLPKLALALMAFGMVLGASLWLALERQPLAFEPAAVTSAAKRQAYARVREGPAVATSLGEAREIRLDAGDLDTLLAWGLSLGGIGAKGRVLLSDEHASLEGSVGLPRTSRFLNLQAAGRLRVESGQASVEAHALRVGRLAVPRLLLQPFVSLALAAVARDRRVQPVLQAVESVERDEAAFTAVVRRRAIPRRLLLELVRGEPRRPEDEAAVRAQLAHLLRPTAARRPTSASPRPKA